MNQINVIDSESDSSESEHHSDNPDQFESKPSRLNDKSNDSRDNTAGSTVSASRRSSRRRRAPSYLSDYVM